MGRSCRSEALSRAAVLVLLAGRKPAAALRCQTQLAQYHRDLNGITALAAQTARERDAAVAARRTAENAARASGEAAARTGLDLLSRGAAPAQCLRGQPGAPAIRPALKALFGAANPPPAPAPVPYTPGASQTALGTTAKQYGSRKLEGCSRGNGARSMALIFRAA